jgi:hypothetical protein
MRARSRSRAVASRTRRGQRMPRRTDQWPAWRSPGVSLCLRGDEYYSVHADHRVAISWSLATFINPDEADKLINQVMPTVKFTS